MGRVYGGWATTLGLEQGSKMLGKEGIRGGLGETMVAESQSVRLGDAGRKWETLNARREVQGGLGKLQVCGGKPAEGGRGRPRPGLRGKMRGEM